MYLLIGADLVPTDTNIDLFISGNAEALVGKDLLSLLKNAGYRVFNLEVPLTDKKTPIDKCGPALIAPTQTIAGYKAIGTDLLTISNNHIMDQGVQGLNSTIDTLGKVDIAYVGGGNNLAEAKKPYIIDLEDKKIGVYACAEHEFSVADTSTPGANPFDPLESPDHVAELKAQCDYVIVLYHGGKEHYRYPSPALQKTCRKLVEKGADLVLCQHSHCVGCEEKYLHGTIVYGQGNFLFDSSESEYWQTSLLVQIQDDFSVSYIPMIKHGNSVRLASGEQRSKILKQFQIRGEQIQKEGFIEAEYAKFAEASLQKYLMSFFGSRSIFFQVANKLTGRRFIPWLMNIRYGKKKRLAIRNFIECEAHRELVIKGLNKK